MIKQPVFSFTRSLVWLTVTAALVAIVVLGFSFLAPFPPVGVTAPVVAPPVSAGIQSRPAQLAEADRLTSRSLTNTEPGRQVRVSDLERGRAAETLRWEGLAKTYPRLFVLP